MIILRVLGYSPKEFTVWIATHWCHALINFPTMLIIGNELAQTIELLSLYESLISEYENGESRNWRRNIAKSLYKQIRIN